MYIYLYIFLHKMIFFVWYLILSYKANSKLVLLYNEVTSTHKPNGFFEVTSPLYFFLCAM
jgi:hypothetical protein